MKTDLITWLTKISIGVATAATLGAGTAVIRANATDAVQNQRISALEADRAEMHELTNKLDETNRNVAVLNERLNQKVKQE